MPIRKHLLSLSAICLCSISSIADAYQPPRMNVVVRFELQNMPFRQEVVTDDETARLDAFLDDIKVMSTNAFIISGHTDRLEAASTQDLAERRAAAVRDYMVEKGVDPKRIFWEGRPFDETPAESGRCADHLGARELIQCLGASRRVTIEVTGSVYKVPYYQHRLRKYLSTPDPM